jgi:hypothetical protein
VGFGSEIIFVLSVMQTMSESIDFRRQEHFRYSAPLCALAHYNDGIVVGEFVSLVLLVMRSVRSHPFESGYGFLSPICFAR